MIGLAVSYDGDKPKVYAIFGNKFYYIPNGYFVYDYHQSSNHFFLIVED